MLAGVDSGAAAIDADPAGLDRLEGLLLLASRVVEEKLAHARILAARPVTDSGPYYPGCGSSKTIAIAAIPRDGTARPRHPIRPRRIAQAGSVSRSRSPSPYSRRIGNSIGIADTHGLISCLFGMIHQLVELCG